MEFKNIEWQSDHLHKLKIYYQNAPYVNEVFRVVEPLYKKSSESPLDFILATMKTSMSLLGIETKILKSSDLDCRQSKAKLMLEICKKVGASVYLCGTGAREYMTPALSHFAESGIEIRWQEFRHPKYVQGKEADFVEGLGCLDLLFYNGFKNSATIFMETVNGA